MAWTKTKTAAVTTLAVILAAGTTVSFIHRAVEQKRDSRPGWTFRGYGDPKSALVSFLWAVREADGERIWTSLSPDLQRAFQQRFEQQAQLQGKSLREVLAQQAAPRFAATTGIRILEQRDVSADRIQLQLLALGEQAEHVVIMKKIGSEWKVDQASPSPASNETWR